jgi:hypothetical protein
MDASRWPEQFVVGLFKRKPDVLIFLADWSIQSPLFAPGSVAGVRAGAAARISSLFLSRTSLYLFKFKGLITWYYSRITSEGAVNPRF